MSYKSILVHVDKSRNASQRIKLAALIALNENAHLVGAAVTGVSRFIYQAGLINDNDPNLTVHLSDQLETLRERAKDALNDFARVAREMNVPSFESQLVDDEADGGIALRARRHDLVVVGQTDLEQPSPSVPPDFPESVVLNSGRPVLIVPFAGEFKQVGARVMVGWNASVQSTRAITNAIPMLMRANIVEIVVFNPEWEEDADDLQPGDDIALYLAHHDVKANAIRQKTDIDIGNALLSMATDLNSDLIVMGAYGRSRFREMLLGGATRTVLESMTIPVLMSN